MKFSPLVDRPGSETFAFLPNGSISVGQFCADIGFVASALPPVRHLVNLASDRYIFTVIFFAAISRGQTVLLPAQREDSVDNLDAEFESTYLLRDGDAVISNFKPGQNGSSDSPECAENHPATIVFTSGSTGVPKPHAKTWGLLDRFRRQHWSLLRDTQPDVRSVLATVPSWHMYGLEWALLLPTVAPLSVFCGADFYPRDIAEGLGQIASPVLVSTPVHLSALRANTKALEGVRVVMSATAPLDRSLASEIEASSGTKFLEIYGCSEVGTVAYRHSAHSEVWTVFPDFDCDWQKDQLTLRHPHLDTSVTLEDTLDRVSDREFLLKGRRGDIVKIAGRRESLMRVNAELLKIPGVEDGVVLQPSQFSESASERLAALIVAPDVSSSEIRRHLARSISSVFIPRPLVFLESIPRDKTGKLKASEFLRLLQGEVQ